jgi:glutathione synthase
MKIAVLMNRFEELHAEIDTTLSLLRAAFNLGWFCCYFNPEDLVCRGEDVYARSHLMTSFKKTIPEGKLLGEVCLTEFDIILMRQDPPVNSVYLYASYALELAEKKGVLVANKPQAVRDFNEKMAILNFPSCIPPTIVSADLSILRDFWKTHGEVVYKSLDSLGGRAVFYVGQEVDNLSVILETLTARGHTPIMAQRYIPEIKTEGDQRILLFNGEPISHGLLRRPQSGELRGNIVAGAQGRVVPLSLADRALCLEIGPTLREKGLSFVGLDVIGGRVTEINVTSPSCLTEIQMETGLHLAEQYWLMLVENLPKQ